MCNMMVQTPVIGVQTIVVSARPPKLLKMFCKKLRFNLAVFLWEDLEIHIAKTLLNLTFLSFLKAKTKYGIVVYIPEGIFKSQLGSS